MAAMKSKPGRVRSALLNWLGVPIGLTDGTFWSEWAGTSNSGQAVNVDAALQLSTVWACVRLISDTVSTLPLGIYERMPDGSRRTASDHPLHRLLSVAPNSEMTPARFMQMVVASILLRGNAFVEKRRIGSRVVALHPLLPQNMTVKRLENGRLQYTYTESRSKRVIPDGDLMHIRGFGLDGVCGALPVKLGRDVFGAAMSADEAAAKVFAEGLQASGVLTSETGTLKPEQREVLRKSLAAFAGSKNAGKLMVLEAGLKYQGITMNPEAAQMLQTRAFNVEEMCRWFAVPPFMVGHMDKASSWASSVEGQNLHFLTSCLRPLLENIEQEITRCLIDPTEWDRIYGEFAVEGLLRADSAGRAAYYSAALADGWMNRDEVRRKENLPPIEGGDLHTVQAALIPLGDVGKNFNSGE